MSVIAVLTEALTKSGEFLKSTLADFTDADMLVRPCEGANHAAWMLGHLIHTEYEGMVLCGASMPEILPALRTWGKEQQALTDVSQIPTKDQLIAEYSKTRAATIAYARTLNDQQLEDTRGGKLPKFAPTVGGMLMLFPLHGAMHTGQMQVIRRKLKKPILM